MKPVRGIRWPQRLTQYTSGVGTEVFESFDERGNAETGRMDLLCCKPTKTVDSYRDLTELVAQIAIANPHYQLYFRGQSDYYTIGSLGTHSLCPSLWRGLDVNSKEYQTSLSRRCQQLFKAGEVLVREYESFKHRETETEELLLNNPLTRWAVLQHYELCNNLCGTPMLDISQSLRVAASFALLGKNAEGYLYVLGMPYQREMFSVDSISGITSVSLLGAMPSAAIRPYVQSGYLAIDNDWWRLYALDNEPDHHKSYHVNFAERIISCLRIGGDEFWDDSSNGIISSDALYPNTDVFQAFTEEIDLKGKIKHAIGNGTTAVFVPGAVISAHNV